MARAQRERASSHPQPLHGRDGLPGPGRGPGWYRREGMKGRSSPQTVEVLGIRFHNLSRVEAARAIEELARAGDRAYVVKPYSEYMPPAARDADLREVLNRADLCLADEIGRAS